MKQTILHIGLEKTGTTSLQFLFRQNRDRLLTSGLLVSGSSSSGNNFHLAVASYSKFRADGLTRQLGITNQSQLDRFRELTFSNLKYEISAAKPDSVLLSSEHFQSRLTSISDISLLKSSLESAGLDNFRVLLYLRDPLKIAMSHHGMAIKKGVHVTDDFYRPQHARISHIIDSAKTLDNWSAVFGVDAIDVRLYPEGQPSRALIDDFLDACGLSEGQLDLSKQERRNVNLSAEALHELNKINSKSGRVRKLADDRWLFNRLEKVHPGRGLSPSAEVVARFQDHFAVDHKKISKQWFDGKTPLFDSSWPQEQPVSAEAKGEVAESIRKLLRRAELRQRLTWPLRAARSAARRLL